MMFTWVLISQYVERHSKFLIKNYPSLGLAAVTSFRFFLLLNSLILQWYRHRCIYVTASTLFYLFNHAFHFYLGSYGLQFAAAYLPFEFGFDWYCPAELNFLEVDLLVSKAFACFGDDDLVYLSLYIFHCHFELTGIRYLHFFLGCCIYLLDFYTINGIAEPIYCFYMARGHKTASTLNFSVIFNLEGANKLVWDGFGELGLAWIGFKAVI